MCAWLSSFFQSLSIFLLKESIHCLSFHWSRQLPVHCWHFRSVFASYRTFPWRRFRTLNVTASSHSTTDSFWLIQLLWQELVEFFMTETTMIYGMVTALVQESATTLCSLSLDAGSINPGKPIKTFPKLTSRFSWSHASPPGTNWLLTRPPSGLAFLDIRRIDYHFTRHLITASASMLESLYIENPMGVAIPLLLPQLESWYNQSPPQTQKETDFAACRPKGSGLGWCGWVLRLGDTAKRGIHTQTSNTAPPSLLARYYKSWYRTDNVSLPALSVVPNHFWSKFETLPVIRFKNLGSDGLGFWESQDTHIPALGA